MSEYITPTRIEDAIDSVHTFISKERGSDLDGGFASTQLHERILSTSELAEQLFTETPHPNFPGLYVLLHNKIDQEFNEALHVLPGHILLLPSITVDKKDSSFYPAVVSEDSVSLGALRLHVLCQPYKKTLTTGARTILSGAAQAETKGIGNHNRTANDSIEAEHFTALLTISGNDTLASKWVDGDHVNHAWRQNKNTSVTSEMHKNIFGNEIPQTTITITQQDIINGKAALFWHESLRGHNDRPEHAGKQDALIMVQALGFQALKANSPRSIDTIKGMLI